MLCTTFQREMLGPAVTGTINVLKAASAANAVEWSSFHPWLPLRSTRKIGPKTRSKMRVAGQMIKNSAGMMR